MDGVALGYAGGAWFGQGSLKFVQGVLAQDVIIELGVALAVEGEATQFTADVAAIGLVAIVLRPPGTELHNVVPRLYLVGKVAEVIAEHQGRLAWALQEDHGIGVVIQRAIPEEVEGVVEVQSGPAGGETGHEDVEVRGDGDVFLAGFVMYLHAVVGEYTDVPHVELVAFRELAKVLRLHEFYDLGAVKALSEFALHAV